MNRTQKLKLNTFMSLINRFILMISGIILPRIILINYGSETNGLISSITQFLSIITFLDMGVGTVIQSTLYRPLIKNDNETIGKILSAAKTFFRNIAYCLVAYVIVLIIIYPIISNSGNYSVLSTAMLIIAISISQFSQYYFGIVNELLLNADQRSYIQYGSENVVVILNLIISIILINLGFSIQLVKLVSGLIFLFRPFYLNYYVKKHYDFKLESGVSDSIIPQKWNGMAQHIAYSVQNNTDILILTFFSSLESISVYSVYSLVVNAIKLVITSFSSGLTSFFGNLLAEDKIKELNTSFSKIELLIHNLVIFLYGMTAILINQFVQIYTQGVQDTNYYAPIFGLVLILSRAMFSLRTPYQSMVLAAGHFKETQMSSIIEATLNIVLSLILVRPLGLVGVSIGTLISMIYRLLYLSIYLSKNILKRPLKIFLKHIFVDVLLFTLILGSGIVINGLLFNEISIQNWIVSAIICGLIALLFIIVINLLFFNSLTKSIMHQYAKKLRIK